MSLKGLQFGVLGGVIFLLMWVYSWDLEISVILFGFGVLFVGVFVLVMLGFIVVGCKLGLGSMGLW